MHNRGTIAAAAQDGHTYVRALSAHGAVGGATTPICFVAVSISPSLRHTAVLGLSWSTRGASW